MTKEISAEEKQAIHIFGYGSSQHNRVLMEEQKKKALELMIEATDPTFLDNSDEWTKDSPAWDKFKEQLKPRQDALVAQRSEQDAHNVLVTGSSPVEGTTSDKLRKIAKDLLEMADRYERE